MDENGSGSYDGTLAATDLSFEASGTAAVQNNYDGINAVLPLWKRRLTSSNCCSDTGTHTSRRRR